MPSSSGLRHFVLGRVPVLIALVLDLDVVSMQGGMVLVGPSDAALDAR